MRYRGVRLSPPAHHTICSVRSAQTGALCFFFFSSPSLPSSADTSLQASGVVRDRYQIFRWRVHSSDDYNNPTWKMWVCLFFVVYLCIHWQFSNDTKVYWRKHAWCCADLIIFSVMRRMLCTRSFFGTNLDHLKIISVAFCSHIIFKVCKGFWLVIFMNCSWNVIWFSSHIYRPRICRLIYI